jgi:hypothetical protein
MGATVLAILIAAGLGLIAGGYYAVMGWIVVGNLLLLTTATAAIAAHAQFLVALGWAGLTLVAFNIGLILSLMIRNTAVLRRV